MVRGMRVLLVSPTDPKVPGNLKFLMGGENTYTRTLLAHPPPGVTYVHHLDALQNREVVLGPLHQPLRMLIRFRVFPLAAGTFDLVIRGAFDLVHCHAYTLRLTGVGARDLPVVMGDSIPSYWTAQTYFGYGPLRTWMTYGLRRLVHGALGVFDQDLSLGHYSSLVVMSEFAKREHIEFGADPSRIIVVHPGLPDRLRKRERKREAAALRLLFAGVWFRRKGGLVLWEAYLRVRKRFGQKVQLTILGPLPEKVKSQKSKFKSLGIVQHDYVPYDRLVGEFYPSADILVHVPPKVEGYGLVVEEAMSFGLPVVASNIGALPELVVDGKTGFLIEPGSVDSLEEALARLVRDESLREQLGKAARKRFLSHFSLPVMHRKLLGIYSKATHESGHHPSWNLRY